MKASTYRVGIDIVDVHHIQESIERFGERFLNRIFTAEEQRYCTSRVHIPVIAQSFAARFAAKEAAIKVLRPDPFSWSIWRSIEIRRSSEGWCEVILYGEAAELAARRGINALSVSLSHEEGYATAVVVADFY